MKQHEVHVLKKSSSFTGSMKDDLAKEVAQFLNKKSAEGYEVINVSFTYFETQELIAFVTICR